MGRRAGVRLLLLPGLLLALLWAPCAGGPGQARPHAGAVAVTCEPHRMVVAVHRDLFGGGRLVAPADLALGRPRCPPASVDAGATVVRFEAGLHECGSTVQVMTPTLLIYRTSLFYTPSLASGRVILRTSATEIPIECRYPRTDNVSSGALQPHWVPFQATAAAKARLGFSLRLMKDDWSAERTSALFQLGEALCVQAEVLGDAPLPLRLFVDHCAASLSPDASSGPQYAIVASSGCLVDGRQEGVSSTFLSPRPRPEALRFTIDAFRFAGDPRKVIYITCHLKAVPAEQAPDAGHKACSFDAERSQTGPSLRPPPLRRACVGAVMPGASRGGVWAVLRGGCIPRGCWGARELLVETPCCSGGASVRDLARARAPWGFMGQKRASSCPV
uniref:Zona pellucida sperm-binding protein 3 n=1 Tax=Varanus komodoensis TaxID=61221 RepID=A0A8D2LDU1_VARKO